MFKTICCFLVALAPLQASLLVGDWRFNNGGNLGQDSSGNGYQLTAAGTPTFDAAARGGAGAVALNGSSYFFASIFPAAIPIGSASFSLTAWINPTTTPGGYGIIGYGNYGTTNAANALRTNAGPDGILHYFWADDVEAASSTIYDGLWHFVAATWDGSTQTVYIDPAGANIVASSSGSPSVAGTNFTVGLTNGGEAFTGELSDVRVYSGALSQAELVALQNTAPASSVPEPSTFALLAVPAALFGIRRLRACKRA